MSKHFQNIPNFPPSVDATSIIARFVDGLGFRYFWATEGLTENEIQFKPHPTSLGVLDLIKHLYDMAVFTNRSFGGVAPKGEKPTEYAELRAQTLFIYEELSERLKAMDANLLIAFELYDGSLPNKRSFWYYLNGPIADSLTHVGQITSWRRIAGNPQPAGVNAFYGTGPNIES
jgi:hypothetical protein